MIGLVDAEREAPAVGDQRDVVVLGGRKEGGRLARGSGPETRAADGATAGRRRRARAVAREARAADPHAASTRSPASTARAARPGRAGALRAARTGSMPARS